MITCNKCRVEKPDDQFALAKKSKDGHKHTCKTCINTWQHDHHHDLKRACPNCGLKQTARAFPGIGPGKRSDVCQTCLLGAGTKVCSKCHKVKELTDFPRNKSSRGGVHNECKLCFKESGRKHYYEGAKSGKEYNSKWVKDHQGNPAFKARINRSQQNYRLTHWLETKARWWVHKLKNELHLITPTDYCQYCGKPVSKSEVEAHHFVAGERRYFPENWGNVHWLCHDCHVATRRPGYVEKELDVTDLDKETI